MSEPRVTVDDDWIVIHKATPSGGDWHLPTRWGPALLDALLREKGYEKRWMAWSPHHAGKVRTREDAEQLAEDFNRKRGKWREYETEPGDAYAVPLFVPRQGEGE